jgi:hypothetical protein
MGIVNVARIGRKSEGFERSHEKCSPQGQAYGRNSAALPAHKSGEGATLIDE